MADTTLSNGHAFPQDDGTGVSDGSEDVNYAALFGVHARNASGEYVDSGFNFQNVDTTNDEVDVSDGLAFIEDDVSVTNSERTDRPEFGSGSQTNTYDAKLPSSANMVYAVVLTSTISNISLDSSANNDVWLYVDVTANDSVKLRHGSAVSDPATDSPPKPSLKLGTVDTSDGSTTTSNDGPSFEVRELIDGAGVTHAGELADAADIDSSTVTASGDGSTTTFTLSHGLGSTPTAAHITPTSEDASTDFWVSNKTSSNIDITYASAPASGTDNLTYDITVH